MGIFANILTILVTLKLIEFIKYMTKECKPLRPYVINPGKLVSIYSTLASQKLNQSRIELIKHGLFRYRLAFIDELNFVQLLLTSVYY